jgi:hypothetical protein
MRRTQLDITEPLRLPLLTWWLVRRKIMTNTPWWELFHRTVFLKNLYRDVSQFTSVAVNKIEIKQHGPEVTLVIEVPAIPNIRPRGWQDAIGAIVEFNAVLASKVSVTNFPSGGRVANLEVQKHGAEIAIRATGRFAFAFPVSIGL